MSKFHPTSLDHLQIKTKLLSWSQTSARLLPILGLILLAHEMLTYFWSNLGSWNISRAFVTVLL